MRILDVLAQRANILIMLYLLVNLVEYYGQVTCADAG
jgi:hypothetical protein